MEVQSQGDVLSTNLKQNEAERKELPKKIKYLTALNIFYGNIAFGAALNSFGPSLTTLQNKYDVDDATISATFSILTGAGMIGALLGGVLVFDRMNRQLAVIICIIIKAVCIFLCPHCPSIGTYFAVVSVLGLATGAYDSAQFVWILEMMQKDCPPYCQTQHFCYAIGTTVGALIIAPFLDEDGSMSAQEKADKLILPFSVLGGLLVLNAAFQIFLFTFFRYFKPPPEETDSDSEKGNDENLSGHTLFGVELWSWPKFRFVILCCLFYGAYQGMEQTTFAFFPKFGQNSDLHLSESDSAYTLSGMTAAFAAGRGVAIFLVFKISVQIILCGNIALLVIANIMLVGWASGQLSVLWASGIIYGLGFSSCYAGFAAYIERYLNVTNFIASLLLIFGSGVAAIYPLIVGSFIENSPIVLGYVVFFSIAIIVFVVGTLSFLTARNKKRY